MQPISGISKSRSRDGEPDDMQCCGGGTIDTEEVWECGVGV